VTVTRSTVSGNRTSGVGANGGGVSSQAAVTVTGSTVSGNSTGGSSSVGGGIFSTGAVTVTRSTVSGNSTAGFAARGGGVFSSGNITLSHSTVTDNHAHATGGGIWSFSDTITITNSIVAGNTADGGNPDLDLGTSALTVDYSLIGDSIGSGVTGGSGVGYILDQSANLAPLADNGGLTQTHALLVGSPAIDAGDPAILPNPGEFDQRGAPFLRVVDDPIAPGTAIDIGAFEHQALISPSADFNMSGFIEGFDFLAWQRGFGTTTGASKGAGDADNDGDVDGTDLGFWEAQFGGPAPLVGEPSAVSDSATGGSASNLGQAAPSQSADELIDAVLAWNFASAANAKQAPPVEDQPTSTVATHDAVPTSGNITPLTLVSEEIELPARSSIEHDDAEDQWLSDELLERVFG